MHTILVVDDDLDMLNLYRFFLANAGYNVHTLSNPIAAVEMIEYNQYDLVITDILMPELNGIELTKIIHDKRPSQKILVCSEGGTTDAKEIVASIVLDKAIQFGALEALRKPFTKTELLSKIEAILSDVSQAP
ncbi:MAG: response regulator [Bdellovibrio sp.]